MFRIVTQARRGAGTTASVRVHHLKDCYGNTAGPFPWIRNQEFSPSSTVFQEVVLPLNSSLDCLSLSELLIGHDSMGDAGTGWMLQGVGVSALPPTTSTTVAGYEGEVWFPHRSEVWLGESDTQDGHSGPPQVALQPASTTVANTQRKLKESSLHAIEMGAFAIPEASKIRKLGKRGRVTSKEGWAGEDAYFINSEARSFGVADGVSQWAEVGIDAGLFARELIRGAAEVPTLEHAFEFAKASGLRGSSTLAICKVDLHDAECHCETIGDSQVLLVHSTGRVGKRTLAQEHAFGVPFQLDSDENKDRPGDGLQFTWGLQPGDLIVVGSDGLFDNVGEEDIAQLVTTKGKTCSQIAVLLASKAFDLSQEKRGSSPYSRAASEALNLAFSGGKSDDITVVVARVL
ncbi:hypothetical protein BASA81_008038 [Batrachochytrium salamandrivorans]|nr:hypothetical protein BASA81_008038 [Batrachochytrium salamandrivorans]